MIDIYRALVAILYLLTTKPTVLESFVNLGHYALLNRWNVVVFVLLVALYLRFESRLVQLNSIYEQSPKIVVHL